MKKNICVFGGSVSGKNIENKETAEIIGKIIANSNFNIVFGGGENGIMGAVAQSAINYGASTIGIIPSFLLQKDLAASLLPNPHFLRAIFNLVGSPFEFFNDPAIPPNLQANDTLLLPVPDVCLLPSFLPVSLV